MSLVARAHAAHKQFRANIAAKAVPDLGIDLKRKVIPVVHRETAEVVPIRRVGLDVFGPIVPLTEDDIAFGPRVLGPPPIDRNWRPKTTDIQRVVAHHYGIQRIEMISSRRTANVVEPRQVAMYLTKILTAQSLPEIGRRFGGRDHTTVLHAVRKIEAKRKVDGALKDNVQKLIDIIHPEFVASSYFMDDA